MFATNVCVYDCFCLWPLFLCSLLCLHVITAMSINMMICVMTTIVKIYDSVYVYAYQHVDNCVYIQVCISVSLSVYNYVCVRESFLPLSVWRYPYYCPVATRVIFV